MNKIILYYFSGTGNTLKIARHMQNVFRIRGLECEISNMETVDASAVQDTLASKPVFLGLCFPVAIQSTFPLVWDFVKALPETKGQAVFMVDTMDAFSGGVVGPMKKILKEKGYKCMGAKELKMSNSMQTKAVSLNELERKNARAVLEAERFVYELLEGRTHWNRVPVLSDWMRQISAKRKIWTQTSRKIAVEHERCVLCKRCLNKCPVRAISLEKGHIDIDHTKCISCMRCVHQCPANAFLIGGKRVYQQENGVLKKSTREN